MTADIGLFPLFEDPRPELGALGGPDDADCSRDTDGAPRGVLYARGVSVRILSPDLVISMISSSESLAKPFSRGADVDEFSFLEFSSHFPFGCIVT